MRIATWNLERPKTHQVERIAAIMERLASIEADVWILTETNDAVNLSDTHPHWSPTVPVKGLHEVGERWATIWSKYTLLAQPTYDATIAVCCDVLAPQGPLIVYGTVLPYHADRGPDGTAPNWAEFYRVTELQAVDWRGLKDRFPDRCRAVVGDLNQSRDGRLWGNREYYGTKLGRALLTSRLNEAGLESVTDVDFVATGMLSSQSSIDHICLDHKSARELSAVSAWEAGECSGRQLSDHNGVLAAFVA